MQITIKRGANSWLAVTNDPEIKALFGTDTLPMPYTLAMQGHEVLAIARKHNPAVIYTLADSIHP